MNQNLAPTLEDLNSPAIDVVQGIGEVAVVTYNEGTDVQSDIGFDSFL